MAQVAPSDRSPTLDAPVELPDRATAAAASVVSSPPPRPAPPPPDHRTQLPLPQHLLVPTFADLSLAPPLVPPLAPLAAPAPPPQMLPIHPLPLVRHPIPPLHHHPAMAATHLLQHHHAHTYYMWVPQDRVGAVIGGHGAVIRSLQERSGATIQVHNDTVQGDLKLFTIFGTLNQYEIAKQLISDIIDKPRHSHPSSQPQTPADRTPFPSAASVTAAISSTSAASVADHQPPTPRLPELWKTVYVPTSCVGLVIGRNGETIRNLQDRSGAEIKVTPDEEARPGADTRSILLSGTEDAIATAHQLVSEIVMDARSRRPPHPPQQVGVSVNGQPLVLEILSVPNEKVGLIIGKKGAAIRELQIKSGAKIQVTKDDSSVQSDGTRPVTITGMRPNVDDAKAMICSKINVPMLQSSTSSTNYTNSPQQAPSTVSTPTAPSQSVPYLVPNVYEPAYQNGQQPFQQIYESNDPNVQNRASMAYFQYFGYNNYAALAQQHQRQYQSQMSMHYMHPHQQAHAQQPQLSEDLQHQGVHVHQQEEQDAQGSHSPQQKVQQSQQLLQSPQQQQQSPPLPPQQQRQHQQLLVSQQQQQAQQHHGQPPLDGMHGSPGMLPRDANGNVLVFPTHPYQQVPHPLGGHQMYSSGLPNSRMLSRRDQVHAAHAQAQAHMFMQAQAQAAQAQAQSQVHQVQAQHVHSDSLSQVPVETETEGVTEVQLQSSQHVPVISTPLEESGEPNG